MEGAAPGAGDGLLRPHREGHVRRDLGGRGRSGGGRTSVGGVTMVRTTTIQALRNRGISKKTATVLADAGFTLDKLAASKVERLAKYISKKEAEKVLKKLRAAPVEPKPEPKPAPKKEKARPAARGKKPSGKAKAAEAEPETPLTIPVKAAPLSSGEQEIMEG